MIRYTDPGLMDRIAVLRSERERYGKVYHDGRWDDPPAFTKQQVALARALVKEQMD